MFVRLLAACAALLLGLAPAQAGRVALVIGQNAYPGGSPEATGLPTLVNPVPDAKSVVELFAGAGFEVLSCDGKQPGCFDLNREGILKALAQLKARAAGADLALVYFAGHGVATDEGNIVTPIDAKVNCETGAITQGVLVEQFLQAVAPAKHKFLILDACRDNPIGDVCPGLQGKKLAFTRIEAGALQGLLLVTSTQFGQQAKDGPPGTHSPFASALLASLKASPNVYFEQVMNEVARVTYEDAQAHYGFLQIPGKVVGGVAPADCLAGKDCIGDARMAALAAENGQLASDAAGVRNLLADDERARGKPYTAEERKTRVAALQATLASIGKSSDPLRQEARRLIGEGNVAGGEAKLDEALDADEKAAAEQERLAQERRKAAARSARDLAVLASGKDVLKALGYYRRATKLDPSDADLWNDYARAASDAGRTNEAKAAYEQGERAANASNNPRPRYWALLGLGNVARDQGDLPSARKIYGQASGIAETAARADPNDAQWQRDLSASYANIGDVQIAQGDLGGALENFKHMSEILDRLAKADPGNAGWQRDLLISYERLGDVYLAQGNLATALEQYRAILNRMVPIRDADPSNAELQRFTSVTLNKVGNVLVAQGNLPEALKSFQADLAIADRLAKADPGNAGWQRDLSVSYEKVGDVLVAQGNLPEAANSFQASLAIADRLAKADPGNAGWQRDLSVSYNEVGDVLVEQGNLPEALKSFLNSLAIADRLAKADPGNAGWQRDLSVSNERLGDVYLAQGNLATALEQYRASLNRMVPIRDSDPSNAELQRFTSVTLNKVGGVLVAQGNLPEALNSFRDSHAIFDRLAKADPGNAGWQRDLSVSYNKVGDVLVEQGDLPEALKSFQASLAIADRLAKADPGNAGWQRGLSVSYTKVGGVLVAQGNLPEALKSFQGSLAIAGRLAKADPGNAGWQRDLAVSYAKLADVYRRQGEMALAKYALAKGLEIMQRMTALSPDNVEWKKNLAWFDGQIAALEASPFQEAWAQAQAAFDVGQPSKAAAAQAKLAGAVEKAEREKAGRPGPRTASALGALSWYRLFARDFKGALAASERAGGLAPDPIYATNRAHALMFLGRAREAKWLHQMYKGQPVQKDGKLWEAAILDDFKEFGKRGLKHAQMAEIEALLAPAAPSRK